VADKEPLISMPIPLRLVPEVARLLAEAAVPGETAPPLEQEQEHSLPNGWTEASVADAYRRTNGRMRKVLRFLSERPDQDVTAVELAGAAGASSGRHSVAGLLGGFGVGAKRYGVSGPMWEQGRDERGRLVRMPAAVADVIRGLS
jgi:hypothetical protein